MSNVKLVHITPNAEQQIAYCARVSSTNQENPEYEKLLRYLIKHKHWSPYEMASCCIEIETSRAIAAQILRHRSFSFQEFSQRYSEATEFEISSPRRQDTKNKQNSIDDMDEATKDWFAFAQSAVNRNGLALYQLALDRGIAKESARVLLPLSTKTKMYMHGTVRSFIHYVETRTHESTQLEHREIAEAIKQILKQELPTVAKALDWK
jgi:thymidylate synthase (FAD)